MRDSYGREITYLRLSVTDRCNLRCRYCMPAEGGCKREHTEMLTEEELVMAVRAAASLGIKKLRITGGEPLVKRNICSICARCAQVPGIGEVCLTTNGTLLAPVARELRAAGVSRVNISLDTLDEECYRDITRGGALADALSGLEAALSAGFRQVKVNTVLLGGVNQQEIGALASLTKRYPIDLRFIELMPLGGEGSYLPCDAVLSALPDLVPLEEHEGVARLYRLPGGKGRVGLISPVSAHFCASCDRVRITPDGKVKPCLHARAEYPLKGLEEGEMRETIRRAILAKPQAHGALRGENLSGRNMNQIGG